MPFLLEKVPLKNNLTRRKAIILRMYHPHTLNKLTPNPHNTLVKRVSRFTFNSMSGSVDQTENGSMTVEAAAAVPIFMCFFVNVISLMLFFHVFVSNLEELHQQGRQLAMLAAAAGEITELNEEMIELVKPVKIKSPIPMIGYSGTTIVSCCYMRAWTGYDVKRSQAEGVSGEGYVYLTENGSVYHTKESCTHLSLSIDMTAKSQLGSLRNEDGGKYTPCDKCGGEGSSLVYVTREGDHYHNTITCSGLKRTIRRIPVSEAAGLPACGRCG